MAAGGKHRNDRGRPLKILYDISVLGLGHSDPSWRTGIFRVVERLAFSLLKAGECDLRFCAGESFELLLHSADYLETAPELSGRRVAAPFGTRLRAPVHRALQRSHRAVSAPGGGKRYPLRIARKALYHADNLLGPFTRRTIPEHLLAQADIYHSPFFPFPAGVAGVAGRRKLRRFITVYDLIPILEPDLFIPGAEEYLKRLIAGIAPEDFVLCISQSTKNDLCSFDKRIAPEKMFVTHLAAAESFYPCADAERQARVREKYGIPPGVYFLAAASKALYKNMERLLRCFSRLVEQEKITDLNLVLVGQPEAVTAGPAARVIFTGFIPDEDLAVLYSGALAYIYPSLLEGFGLPPLEAMQCGAPVITSNVSSLPEVVGDAALLVSPADENALCQAMLSLYRSEGLCAALRAKGLVQAGKFSWEKCARDTLAGYRAAMG